MGREFVTPRRPTPTPTAILLDTNALLWLVSAPGRVADVAQEILREPTTELFVSAASAWEIAIKTQLGRLDGEPFLSAWSDVIGDMTATELPIDSGDTILAGRLSWDHRDPFDRVIVAQAARRNLTIATSDSRIQQAALTPTLKI
ncbi:type II toxin-antitoxin system VapC family toxin [Mycobacterium hubeiense]|uniref:type II toxin-antitoxin system VapC family toxin n=1 Tax=Mycobacterium hubeiense TaxID=1867256 RepID=UPI000C7F4797|nr:type II toxin-antitoxin system VapC family toxin [Mycobacterium sp. QGD 101]